MTQRIIGQLHATNRDVRPPVLVLITSSGNTFSAQDEDAQTAFGDDVRQLGNQGWEVLKDSLSTSSTDAAKADAGADFKFTLLEACTTSDSESEG